MAKLSSKERKIYRQYLRRKQTQLINKGASASEIRDFFGGRSNITAMDDTRLKKAYYHTKAQKPVEVINGTIYERDYLKKAKAWYGSAYDVSQLPNSFKASQRARLNDYSNIRQIQNHKRVTQREVKNRYIKRLRHLRDTQKGELSATKQKELTKTIQAINKMGMADFNKFISSDNPLSNFTRFDTIFLHDSQSDQSDASSYDSQTVKGVFSDLNIALKQFRASKKRR